MTAELITIDVIIWAACAGALGFVLGCFGCFYTKTAYSIFTACLGLLVFFMGHLVQLTGGDAAGLAVMPSDVGQVTGISILDNLVRSFYAMAYLPFHVQAAIIGFAVAFLAVGIATWDGNSVSTGEKKETLAARKKRVLKNFGMKHMDDVKALR